jgi:putative ABC transport system permease protein
MSRAPKFNFFRLVNRNLKNRPYRNIPALLVFALIAASLFSAQYLLIGSKQSLDKGTRWIGADLMVVPGEYDAAGENILLTGEPTTFLFADTNFGKIIGVPGVMKATPQIYIGTLSASCCSVPLQLVAFDPRTDFAITSWLSDNPGIVLGKDDIIIGSGVEAGVGSDLMFFGHPFHVVGVLAPTGMRGVDSAAFIRIQDAYVMADESDEKAVQTLTLPRGMVSAVLVKVEPGSSAFAVGHAIEEEIPGVRTITPTGLLGTVTGHLAEVTRLLYDSAMIVTVIAIFLAGVTSIVVAHELRKEISVLGALGVTRAFILRLLLAETFSLSVIGSLIGIVIAGFLLVAFQDFIALTLRVPFVIPSIGPLLLAAGSALLLSVVIGGVASVYPTIRVIRSEAYQAIGNGGLGPART